MSTSPVEISIPFLDEEAGWPHHLCLRAALPVDSKHILLSPSHMVTLFQGAGDEEGQGMAVKGLTHRSLLLFQLSGKQVKAA